MILKNDLHLQNSIMFVFIFTKNEIYFKMSTCSISIGFNTVLLINVYLTAMQYQGVNEDRICHIWGH